MTALLAVGTSLLALGAFAQSNTVIVVTASRLDAVSLDVMRVPGDVTVIDQESVARSRARSIPELLRSHGNIAMRSVTGNGDTGELSMRGFGENSGLRVLVVVDDQKINRADMGLQDWQQIPLDEIERIEILRGGQSVLYGNHALSGVIRITTKKGHDPKTRVAASAGSHGFQEYDARHSGAIEGIRYTAGANYQNDDGARENARSWRRNANASLSHDLSEDDAMTLRFSGGESAYHLPGPLTYEQYKRDPQQSSNPGDQYAHTDSGLLTFLYEGERAWGSQQLNIGVNMRNIDWFMSGLSGWNQQRGYALSPKIVYGDEADFTLSGGLDLLYDTLDFTGENDVTVNDAALDRITTGPFALATKRLFETLTLSAGARYEHARTSARNVQYNRADLEEFIDNPWGGPPIPNPNYPAKPDEAASFDGSFHKSGWSYETSALWEVSDAFSLWCRYTRVYRYPALDETASYQGYPLADPLNEALDPETGDNFEVGGKARVGSWSASATAFYLLMDDEISYDDQKKLNVNIGSTKRFGADLQLAFERANYGASLMAELVAARFDGGKNDGATVPLVPDAHGVLTLWVEPLPHFRLTGTYTWTAEQYQGGDFGNTQRKLDSYGLLGLRADLTIRERLGLFVKVENVLDEQYASSAYNGGWYPGCGRAFFCGMTLEF